MLNFLRKVFIIIVIIPFIIVIVPFIIVIVCNSYSDRRQLYKRHLHLSYGKIQEEKRKNLPIVASIHSDSLELSKEIRDTNERKNKENRRNLC